MMTFKSGRMTHAGNRRRTKRGRVNELQIDNVNDKMSLTTITPTTRCKIIQVFGLTSNTHTNTASTTLMHTVEHTWECPYCRRPILRLVEMRAIHSSTTSASQLQDVEEMSCPRNVSTNRCLNLVCWFAVAVICLFLGWNSASVM
ncbi:hypothetical protein BsWGS_17448 [Bradybaena similaris]